MRPVLDLVARDLEHLDVLVLTATEKHVGIVRARYGAAGFASRVMVDDPRAVLLVLRDLDAGRLAHEVGHALEWVDSGRPAGPDWGRAAGPRERRASRLGLAWAGLRGVDADGYQGDGVARVEDFAAVRRLLGWRQA